MRLDESPKNFDKRRMTAYLLGQLPEPERQEIAELLFTDERYYEELLAVEDDLIESYARGELPRDAKKLVQERLLAGPQGMARLQATTALLSRTARRPPIHLAQLAAAAIILLAAAMWIFFTGRAATHPSSRVSAGQVNSPIVTTVLLPLHTFRGGATVPVIQLAPNTSVVRFDAPVQAADLGGPYEIDLVSPSGVVRKLPATLQAKAQPACVGANITRAEIAPGVYQFSVFNHATGDKRLISGGAFRITE